MCSIELAVIVFSVSSYYKVDIHVSIMYNI